VVHHFHHHSKRITNATNKPKSVYRESLGSDRPYPDIVKAVAQQQIETEHLMKSLLEQEGLASSILTKAGVNLENYVIAPKTSSGVSPLQAAVVPSFRA
jgi:hypothetical protein